MPYSRRAFHAGSWYEDSAKELKAIIDGLFAKAEDYQWNNNNNQKLIGIISPHAGISYSGTTAAHVYKALRNYLYSPKGKNVSQIFILGPSHHKGFEGVEVSGADQYETPFGNLNISSQRISEVMQSLQNAGVPVKKMSQTTDEEEHSIEMQLPFVSHILHYPIYNSETPATQYIQLVPLLIGHNDQKMEERIGNVLSSYCKDPTNIFILSSDFCHWGSRFQYTYHYEKSKYPNIGDAIIAMDHEGMQWLEKKDMQNWYKYLSITGNTICGRRPISIGISAVKENKEANVRFLHYSQSSKCMKMSDSSVSYAGAVITQG